MGEYDYVGALKWYSQAIALRPNDAALYSNRSFALLRLELPARALADADEAVRRRPTWPKGHFRKAEALTQAGLHTEALVSYEAGAALDPSDEHLQVQCVEARRRDATGRAAEKLHVGIGAAIGIAAMLLLLLSSTSGGLRTRVASVLAGALFGSLGGGAYVMLRRQHRQGAILPPLQTNEHFAALQMKGDRDGAGELRSRVLETAPAAPPPPVGMFSGGAAAAVPAAPTGRGPDAALGGSARGGGGGAGGGEAKRRVKSQSAGRAAAMKAMGK